MMVCGDQFPKLVHKFNAIQIKFQTQPFIEIRKLMLTEMHMDK